MKPRFVNLHMDLAERISQMSYATRLQVGCVIVKENTILSYGWNGMPTGWDNTCEYKDYKLDSYRGEIDPHSLRPWTEVFPFREDNGRLYALKTKPEVLHSEMNALMKVAQSTESSTGTVMFCTHAPCMDCAKAIYQAGISTLYYREEYRSTQGIEFLEKSGVNVLKYDSGDK